VRAVQINFRGAAAGGDVDFGQAAAAWANVTRPGISNLPGRPGRMVFSIKRGMFSTRDRKAQIVCHASKRWPPARRQVAHDSQKNERAPAGTR